MKYIPENKKILIIQENSDSVLIMNEKFDILSRLESSKIIQLNGSSSSMKDNQGTKLIKVKIDPTFFTYFLIFNIIHFICLYVNYYFPNHYRIFFNFYIKISSIAKYSQLSTYFR